MRSLKEISDRQIIQIALILWAIIAIASFIGRHADFAISALIAIALGIYGLRIMRKRGAK